MKLIVISADRPDLAPQSPDTCVLRLVGVAASTDQPPPGFQEVSDRAMARLCATFPNWLWQWVLTSDVLDLRTYAGPISWWWYSPLSEMSPMRSPLIQELYWLTFLRLLCEEHGVSHVVWYGDDIVMARVVRRLVERAGVRFEAHTRQLPLARRRWVAVARRLRASLLHPCLCAALRAKGFRRAGPGAAAVLYSRFPVLWETHGDLWRERMFGDWPETLERRGVTVSYAAVCTASIGQVFRHAREWLTRCERQRILLVDAFATPRDLLRAYADVRFAVSFWRWRRAHRADRVVFDGADVSALFWREIDANALSPEIPYDVTLASTMRRMLGRMPKASVVCLPFEYQPMERAIWTGAQHPTPRVVVGLQTGVYTANQMGFRFPAEQVRVERRDHAKAPLPDVLAAYGEIPYRMFADRLGADRVCWSGPVRYPGLSIPVTLDRPRFLADHGFPGGATCVLVTTSTVRAESIPMLAAAFAAASANDDVVLLLKFHYHLPLGEEVARLAEQHSMHRYKVFDANLDQLLTAAAVTVCGGSSIALEAIARGCMPLVFRATGELVADPMLETPDAAFFWRTPEELASALSSTVRRDESYLSRRRAWPDALRAQLSPLDGQADARLFDFLAARGSFAGPIRA